MKRPYTFEELCYSELIHNYCERTGRGDLESRHMPLGLFMCEGRFCEEAYQTYLEECEEDDNMFEEDEQ